MSLDEPRNPHHAAALERGDDPRPQIPEAIAAERAGRLLRQFVAAPYLSDQFWSEVGGKAMASFGQLSTIHAEMKADPNAIRERDVVLKQQSTARLDQYDWHLEAAAEAKQAWVDHCAAAEAIRAQRLAEFDAGGDARGEREDDARISQERQDEAAAAGMPRTA